MYFPIAKFDRITWDRIGYFSYFTPDNSEGFRIKLSELFDIGLALAVDRTKGVHSPSVDTWLYYFRNYLYNRYIEILTSHLKISYLLEKLLTFSEEKSNLFAIDDKDPVDTYMGLLHILL